MSETAFDHRAFVASLPVDARKALTARSDAAGLRHLALHLGALGLTGTAIALGLPGWPVVLFVHGVLLVFLFTLLHETSHRTPFASPWLNEWVGQACGFALLLPPLWFRYFHLAHHRHTQDPDRDPELASPRPRTTDEYLRHLTGLAIWRDAVANLVRLALGRADAAYLPPGRRPAIVREARVYLAGYAALLTISLAAQSTALLWLWVIPALLGQPVLRLYLLAEHGHCAFVADMFQNTRTTTTNRLVRLLAWNMPYHSEHHSFPGVPFHRLPDLHALAPPHLRRTSPGYGAFHRDYARAVQGK